MAGGDPLGRRDRGQSRPPPRPPSARRGPLRPREDQGTYPRIPRGAPAAEESEEPDSVLRGAARRREDLAREVDRARHGTEVRAPRSAASATRPRSAVTAARTSAPCPAVS